MPNRRHVLATGAAALTLGAGRALAQVVPASETPLETLPPELAPRLVQLQAPMPPGEIHVDPNRFGLYFTLPEGMAIRYSCGIGRPGLYEPGAFFVGAKKEWPSWTPTPEMVERDPESYAQYAEEGMPGGPGNPLGARAVYLFTPDRGDTFLRIHGTDKPETIGQEVSNGCARLVNADVVDLYDRVALNAPVFLYPKEAALPA